MAEKLIIWKHPLNDQGRTVYELPAGAVVLHVGEQNRQLWLWEAHRYGATDTEMRVFAVVGTGEPFGSDLIHVGTIVGSGGVWVGHVFEEPADG